jgi:hypothetical protein
LGIIHAFKCHYSKKLILKTAPRYFTVEAECVVCNVLNNTTHGFLTDHVSSSDSAVKLTEDGKDDWDSLQPLGVQSEGYLICDSVLKFCGVWIVD